MLADTHVDSYELTLQLLQEDVDIIKTSEQSKRLFIYFL